MTSIQIYNSKPKAIESAIKKNYSTLIIEIIISNPNIQLG